MIKQKEKGCWIHIHQIEKSVIVTKKIGWGIWSYRYNVQARKCMKEEWKVGEEVKPVDICSWDPPRQMVCKNGKVGKVNEECRYKVDLLFKKYFWLSFVVSFLLFLYTWHNITCYEREWQDGYVCMLCGHTM